MVKRQRKRSVVHLTRVPMTKSQRRASLSFEELVKLRKREAIQKRKYRDNLSAERIKAIRERDRLRKRLARSMQRLSTHKTDKKAPGTANVTRSTKKPQPTAKGRSKTKTNKRSNNIQRANAKRTCRIKQN